MKTESLPASSEGTFPDFTSFPTEGISFTKISYEEPSYVKYQPSALAEDQSPKPLTHYKLEIASQDGHDQLITYLEAKSETEGTPLVTTLDIYEIGSINIETLFKAFPDIKTLYLNSNKDISMTQLASCSSLRELTFDQVKIYWDEGEKDKFINQNLGKNLSIYLTTFPYFYSHLSAQSCKLLSYLFNALILFNILELGYTNYKSTDHNLTISNRLLVNMIGSLILRIGLTLYWLYKSANESWEITREKKNQ